MTRAPRLFTPLLAAALSLVLLLPAFGQTAFLEVFNGTPIQPQPWQAAANWQVTVLGFDPRVGTEDPNRQLHNVASHGPNCEAPGFPFTPTNSHVMRSALDMVFLCGVGAGTHLMTAAGICGYCAVYMTPPVVADISAGPATLSIDMSTLRTSSRDWIQWVLTPDDGHHELAFISTDLHRPDNYIKIEMGGTNTFILKQRHMGGPEMSITQDSSTTYDAVLLRQVPSLLTSMSRRDTFRATVSRTNVSFGMPQYNFAWANNAVLPRALDPAIWHDKVQLQINHVSYNAQKSCEAEAIASGLTIPEIEDQFNIVNSDWTFQRCPAVTWHWDNLNISPSIPYTVIPSVPTTFESITSAPFTVQFAAPAPAGARLSFLAYGDTPQLRVSFDGGTTWVVPRLQPATAPNNQDAGEQVSMPIPQGQRSVMVRGAPSWVRYLANNFKIVGPPGQVVPISTPFPTPTLLPATATAIATIQATAVPTPTPTPTPTLLPATATAVATQTAIIAATLTAEPTLLPSPTPTMTPEPLATPTPTATPAPVQGCRVKVEQDGVEGEWLTC